MKYTLLPAIIFILMLPLGPQSYAQTLNDATQTIKQETGGRILSTKTIKNNGETIYKIKVLLPSGKVQTFKVSAK